MMDHPTTFPSRRGLAALAVPLLAAGMIFVILVPMPPAVMDLLLAGNIAVAAVILLTTIFASSPLEFSVFPSVLLGATLLRLVLNIATTRLILTAGEDGRSVEQAQLAAGKVIWSFSEFVTGGSLAVGVILFGIIAVIQFVVITKGAARISEVAARFVLDAMPGKQMAIDADLNAGILGENEAGQRRERIAREADFYGAMDGASKFLRGDAVAAVIITLVNLFGGLYLGLVQYGWDLGRTAGLFTRLTIGDGLVAQIPALLVSVSAALMVTRSTSRSNLGEDVVGQLSSHPAALGVTALFLLALSATSLPKLPLLALGLAFAAGAWVVCTRNRKDASHASPSAGVKTAPKPSELPPDASTIQPMRIELGYALIRLAEASRGGDLLERVGQLRSRIASRLGLVLPAVRVADNMTIGSHTYRICIREAVVATGRLQPGRLLALGEEVAIRALPGVPADWPEPGVEGVWIRHADREEASEDPVRILEASEALLEQLEATIRRHAGELLTRQMTADMVEALRPLAPKLVEDVSNTFTTGQIQRILQALLAESVSISDLEGILEALLAASEETQDPVEQLQRVRQALRRTICQACSAGATLQCVTASSEVEELLSDPAAISGDVARRLAEAFRPAIEAMARNALPAVVVCAAPGRSTLRQMLTTVDPDVTVLSYAEIEGVRLEAIQSVSLGDADHSQTDNKAGLETGDDKPMQKKTIGLF